MDMLEDPTSVRLVHPRRENKAKDPVQTPPYADAAPYVAYFVLYRVIVVVAMATVPRGRSRGSARGRPESGLIDI